MKRKKLCAFALLSLLIFMFSCSSGNDSSTKEQDVSSKEIRAKILNKSITEQEKVDLLKNRNLGDFSTTAEKTKFVRDLFELSGGEFNSDCSESEMQDADIYEILRFVWMIEELNTVELESIEAPFR